MSGLRRATAAAAGGGSQLQVVLVSHPQEAGWGYSVAGARMRRVVLSQLDPPQLRGPLVESRWPPERRRWCLVPCRCLPELQAVQVRLRYPLADLK